MIGLPSPLVVDRWLLSAVAGHCSVSLMLRLVFVAHAARWFCCYLFRFDAPQGSGDQVQHAGLFLFTRLGSMRH